MSKKLDIHTQNLIRTTKNDTKYNPKLFTQMLAQNGNDAYKTITDMLTPPTKVQEGFTKLSMLGRLDLTIEALVLYSDFTDEFTDIVKNEAKRRLGNATPNYAWPNTHA